MAEIKEQAEERIEIVDVRGKAGFVEIFNENSFLTAEYRFFENGRKNRTAYEFRNNLIISAALLVWEREKNDFVIAYRDFYRYNRSSSLRSVERVFYRDMRMLDDPVITAFPRHIMDAIRASFLSEQRLNLYPDFFGDVFLHIASKVVYENDQRGRAVRQTLYDDNEEVVWVINNIWSGDRIISTTKTEGDTVLTAEYEYDASGDRILERNLRNGSIERIVRTENNIDVEELYFNNVLVLRAVWEDGIKVSESRIRN
jgi:hypothetical protein